MSSRGPRIETRRAREFADELLARARAWIPGWDPSAAHADVGRAVLEIAAQMGSEVAERLDRAGDKLALGLLDWLGLRPRAAVAARMPVAFRLAQTAVASVDAAPPVRLSADAEGAPVVFETETALRIVAARLVHVVGADPSADAFFLPPPGLASLDPLPPLPTRWSLRSFAARGATRLQLEPALGIAPDMLLDVAGRHHRVREVNEDLVGIEPALDAAAGLEQGTVVRAVTSFEPFDRSARNAQFHAVYLGHEDLLLIDTKAVIEVSGAQGLAGAAWSYWGLRAGDSGKDDETPGWQPLTLAQGPAGVVTLSKDPGAIQPRTMGRHQSRWIRASLPQASGDATPVVTETVTLRVNPMKPLDEWVADQPPPVDDLHAMANNTPAETLANFFPFGREPRQFDTFYLASGQALSKPRADVRLNFDMADLTFKALSTLRTGALADRLLAGVARDAHLHLLLLNAGQVVHYPHRGPLRPPLPRLVVGPADDDRPVALDGPAAGRVAAWTEGSGIWETVRVAVSSQGSVWVWVEMLRQPQRSGWLSLGSVGPVAKEESQIDGLVHVEAASGARSIYALREQKLFHRQADGTGETWQPVGLKVGIGTIALKYIAPLRQQGAGRLVDAAVLGMSITGKVYVIGLAPAPERVLKNASSDVMPAGLRDASNRIVAVAANVQRNALIASITGGGPVALQVALDGVVPPGSAIDARLAGNHFDFALLTQGGSKGASLVSWTPFDTQRPSTVFETALPAGIEVAGRAATLLASHVVVPGTSNELVMAPVDLAGRKRVPLTATALVSAAVLPASGTRLEVDDWLAIERSAGAGHAVVQVAADGADARGQTAYELDAHVAGPLPAKEVLLFASTPTPFNATGVSASELVVDPTDTETAEESRWLVTVGTARATLHTVTDLDVDNSTTPPTVTATIAPPLTTTPATAAYRVARPLDADVRSLVKLDATTGDWRAAVLDQSPLAFPNAVPPSQSAIALGVQGGKPTRVLLAQPFTSVPASLEMIVDDAIGEWSRPLGDSPASPDLSWEYWNGSGWAVLPGVTDGTRKLQHSGAVRFQVPADLRATDWAGRTDFWIRVRLVGGDYGQARTVVSTIPKASGTGTEQTVERFLDTVRAPHVLGLRVQYAVNAAELPQHLLSEDNGGLREQSDANRTPGAQVVFFTPLASALPTPGRALYLGFDGRPLDGQPVNLLFVAGREHDHDAHRPLVVEAWTGERFEPVVASDDTRALGETGLVSITFAQPTVVTELFGRELSWLRLRPTSDAGWSPSLAGIHLNAVWSSAAETLTRERLGSSDGSPHLALQLARPPLIAGSLDLRVREPLGEDQRTLLQDLGHDVKADVEDLPGQWVQWHAVADTDDAGPTDRVYALDESTGVVRFGDGRHGMIPPAGPDGIVAFAYRRAEPGTSGADDVPAHRVQARATLSLATPIEGVEATFAADRAAGGAPPEPLARIEKLAPARLRHRDRAVTSADLEDLALQLSPDVAQARCLGRGGRVRLVVVMRGDEPRPAQAVRREMRRRLRAALPPSAAEALDIAEPRLRVLEVALKVGLTTLDGSGALADSIVDRVTALFDPVTGGFDRNGWPLGTLPVADDVSAAVIDLPGVAQIDAVALQEARADGSREPLVRALAQDELVRLAADGIRIDFFIVEAVT